ncbi:MAG: hypothetical protein K5923_05160 [Clostridia bacterium]|nr:hypothetical protein [Clostridia bacterium]
MEKSKNNVAKNLIIIFVVIVSVGVLSIGGLYVWLNYDIFPRHKLGGVIPVGVYAPYEDGEVKQYAAEYNWCVYESNIEYLYATYDFVEEDGKMYFKYTSSEERFEVKYDEEAKVLSIYLPENILNGWEKHSETCEWKTFKRK